MKSIIISNQEDFEKKKKAFIAEGRDRFHIITDFDRTLTKAYVNGNKFRSIISQLYEGNSLTEDYRKKAKSLFPPK